MVDYTKDEMRDETWRRWKGGTKLAEDLRNFYTNPRVFARLAALNPMGPALPPAAAKLTRKQQFLVQRFGRGNQGPFRSAGLRLMAQKLSGVMPGEQKERDAARQSGATLPGR